MRERQGEVKGIECLKGRGEDEESECLKRTEGEKGRARKKSKRRKVKEVFGGKRMIGKVTEVGGKRRGKEKSGAAVGFGGGKEW